MALIVRPGEVSASSPIGGKARALASAQAAGLPVPSWIVVAADHDPTNLTEAERDQIREAVAALSESGAPVAVRSSASDEDGTQHSFAGQLESFLLVPPDEVADKVLAVWESASSERIYEYRRQHGLELAPRPPAALVQVMVNADVAGVAFSADAVKGRRGVAVISAVPGLGTSLVSGDTDADTWHVDRGGAILERHIAPKSSAHPPSLDDDQIRAVAALAREAEYHFGRPQDIEWAYEKGTLSLLQSRPITSLGALPDPDGELRVWDNSNIIESYSGVTTPLTFSFASEIYEHVYRQFCRLMRVPESAIGRHDDTFRNMLGLVRGRLYYNLLNWYRVLALLPGYSVNRRFMEQMMGVREGLPASLAREIDGRRGSERARDLGHLVSTLGGLVWQHLTMDRRVRAFYARLDAALAPPVPPLSQQRPDELIAHYRDLRRRLLLAWDAPLVNDFFAMIFYGLLRKLTQTWCGDRDGTLQNDLISAQGGLVSAEPAIRLQRLARLAATAPKFSALLIAGTVEQFDRARGLLPEFDVEYRAYLDKFGERSVNELKLETATLHDNPLPLLRAIGHLAQQQRSGRTSEAGPSRTSGEALRADARRRVKSALSGRPLRRLLFNWVLRHARARVRDRENLRLERTRLFGRVRRIFVELGRRFHALEVLDNPRDVFYLTIDEALAFVEGRSASTSLRELAAVRRREFARFEETPPPADRFETRGIVYHAQTFRESVAPEVVEGDSRQGLGCCPGIVRGQVRVVTDPRAADLTQKAVLVAEHTDPGWIMIFPSALAVLVERGSLLSHAAIVARELGIPAVVSIPDVTKWLKDGDWVEVNGSSGVVRRMPPEEIEAARA